MSQIVAIDIREAVSKSPAGKGIFNYFTTLELIKSREFSWVLLTDTPQDIFKESLNVQIIQFKKGFFWHFAVKKYLTKNPVDIYFSPTSYLTPFLLRKNKCKKVVVVHDLITFLFPGGSKFKPRFIETLFLPQIIRTSSIIAISEHTKQDLLFYFPHLVNVSVCNCGVEHRSHIQKQKQNPPYILSVSSVIPRKNYPTLIEAFNLIKDKIPHELHIVGKFHNKIPCHNKVKFLGYVPQEKLNEKYAQADLFVYPSFYEGFGIPILEALAHACPVICSNTSSMPEVAGDCAEMFDPNNSQELADKMLKVLTNNQDEMVKRGLERVKLFTWARTTERILAVFRKP